MAEKNLKIKIKNTQLAKAVGLDKLKAKLSEDKSVPKKPSKTKVVEEKVPEKGAAEVAKPRHIRAKSKSSFAEKAAPIVAPVKEPVVEEEVSIKEKELPPPVEEPAPLPIPVEEEKKEEVIEEEKLGPTGRHIKDIFPHKKQEEHPKEQEKVEKVKKEKTAHLAPPPPPTPKVSAEEAESATSGAKAGKKVRDFKDVKPTKKESFQSFTSRDRHGLSESDEGVWRKKRPVKIHRKSPEEQEIVRPSSLKIRLPISIKELASEMKLKSAELIQKLFLHGMTYTLNDLLEDSTTVQYIGSEFGCDIAIDTSEEERIQITSQSIKEEIDSTDASKLVIRPPVVAFMGHVDHGKTSLIDAICKSDIVSGEAGAITQHIGAFCCKTASGDLTILDTPGHEAFSAMRARGAEVTDIVVLVVAGDEGLKAQSLEAINHINEAGITIMVALNKCDKPNFNAEQVYRELAEVNLLPEKWGGKTIVINTSAVTGEGISELLEMLALQAEVLELRANENTRARGTVIESELHKGLGNVATVLVQNGTLRNGDVLVFERHWGRVKTMHDERGKLLESAGPSTPVAITGLSGLPSAGDPFIVVKSEKEAKSIVETREEGRKQRALQQRKVSLDKFLQAGEKEVKVLNLIILADVHGSAEALKTSIMNIKSKKVRVNVVFVGVGEISESDVQLASASKAIIIGFHSAVESHAEPLIKSLKVKVLLFDIIYRALDAVRELMLGLLDKIAQEKDTGAAEVKAVFKSSHVGTIAGCLVTNGTISRDNSVRLLRNNKVIWNGRLASIKRGKDDTKEVRKDFECGILLDGFSDVNVGDVIQAYEIIYLTQEL